MLLIESSVGLLQTEKTNGFTNNTVQLFRMEAKRMNEDKNLVLNASPELGEIVIAPEVIEIIIGIAASKVEGVYGMRGTLANSVTELLGRAAHGKGSATIDETGIKVDIYCYITYGMSVLKWQWRSKNGSNSKSYL